MVPALTDLGRSFKGAAAYYLHDKREEGEAVRLTDGRVAWTQTINMLTDDPERAWRMMADTAMSQADLKAAAGVKATGRKLTKPVLAYSLSWHPDETPTHDEQMEAVRGSLTALGLDGYQTLVVCHNDEPHAHVHVMVNRVNPQSGVAATLANSKLRLSEWAFAYERGRGKIWCAEREKNAERRQQGEAVNAARKPRSVYEAEKDVGNDNLAAAFVKTEQRQKDAQLYEMGRTMKAGHARQWAQLGRTFGTVRATIQANTRRAKDSRTAEMKEQGRGRWRDLFQQQRRDRQNFEAAERGTLSKLWSMAFVWQDMRRNAPDADALTIFWTLVSSAQRRAVFDAAQERERRELSAQMRREMAAEHRRMDDAAGRDLEKLRRDYLAQCEILRAAQDRQTAELRGAWRTRNAERRQAFAPFRERAARMRQGQQQGRGRSIRADDQYRRPGRPSGPKPSP